MRQLHTRDVKYEILALETSENASYKSTCNQNGYRTNFVSTLMFSEVFFTEQQQKYCVRQKSEILRISRTPGWSSIKQFF